MCETHNLILADYKVRSWHDVHRKNREIKIDLIKCKLLFFATCICMMHHSRPRQINDIESVSSNILKLLDKLTYFQWWHFVFQLDDGSASPDDADSMCCKSSR